MFPEYCNSVRDPLQCPHSLRVHTYLDFSAAVGVFVGCLASDTVLIGCNMLIYPETHCPVAQCLQKRRSHTHSYTYTPVKSYGRHGINAGKYGCNGEEVVEAAVYRTKVPLVVNRVGEVDHCVERRHARFGKRQVHLQESDRMNCNALFHHNTHRQVACNTFICVPSFQTLFYSNIKLEL